MALVGSDVPSLSQQVGQVSHLSLQPVFVVAQRPLLGRADIVADFLIDPFALGQQRPHLVQPPGQHRGQGVQGVSIQAREGEVEGIGLEPHFPQTGLALPSQSPDEASAHFHWMAGFVALDNPTSSALTREKLGWSPTEPELLADIRENGYFSG